MDNNVYINLLNKFQEESKGGLNKKMINRHKFELSIFPIKNIYNLNEMVEINMYGRYPEKGYIKGFNDNGTLFIKQVEDDLGRDYSIKNIKKLNI
jgi:hypothetical protein